MTNTIDEAQVAYLKVYAGLIALIGARIYPDLMPQGATIPCVTYTRVSGAPMVCQSGDSHLESPVYQYKVWASTKSNARAIIAQLKAALHGKKITMGDLAVQASIVISDRDTNEPDIGLFTPILEVKYWHGG